MEFHAIFFIFLTIFTTSVLSKPFTIDILHDKDILFPRRSELVKRTAGNNDVEELNQQKVSLTSLIDNIENGLLQTALSVEVLASDPHAQISDVSTSQLVNKRSAVKKESSLESTSPIVLVQTTESVPAIEAVPSHVVIDRVSIFKSSDPSAALFPTFEIQETEESDKLSSENKEEATTANSSGSSESSEQTASSESSEEDSMKILEENVEKVSSAKNVTSSTPSPSTTVSSVPSSSKTPANEKLTVEKELKEKVGEVEAEPVIFTARV